MMRKWIVAGLLLLLTALLFAQTGVYGFLNWDDPDFVTENPFVRQGLTAESIRWALTTTDYIYWQPLVFLSHMAMVSLFGMEPGPQHFLNVLLHAINASLWFLILCRLRFPLWTAAIATAIYAWHPLRVESVAWITERKDVLSGLLCLLTILAYINYTAHRKDWRRFALVALCFALALAAKPVAVTLPLLLLLLDYWPLGRLDESTWRARVMEKVPLLALSLASAVITIAGQRSGKALSGGIGLDMRVANAVRSYAVYLKQTVWPEGLSPLYPFPEAHPGWQIVLSIALLAGLSWQAWKTRNTQPWWAVAWAWYLVALLPNIGLIQVGTQAHADRYTYLPSTMLIAGACFGVAKRLERFRGLLRVTGIAGAAVSVVFFLCTVVQTTYWKNEFELYGRMLEVEPRTQVAHSNLGIVLEQRGEFRKALAHYEEAARISPAFFDARLTAAMGHLNIGQPALALPHAEAAVKLEPALPESYLQLGRALAGVNRTDEAKAALQKGLSFSTVAAMKAPLYMQLGVAEYLGKNDEAALAAFRMALQADPNHWPARKNAGIALGNLGRTKEAIAEFEAYLRANPSDDAVKQAIIALRDAPGGQPR